MHRTASERTQTVPKGSNRSQYVRPLLKTSKTKLAARSKMRRLAARTSNMEPVDDDISHIELLAAEAFDAELVAAENF